MPIVVAVVAVDVVIIVVAGVAGVAGVVVGAGDSIVTTPVFVTDWFFFVPLSEECRSCSKFFFYGATSAGALAVPSLPTGFSSGLLTNRHFFVTLPDTAQ